MRSIRTVLLCTLLVLSTGGCAWITRVTNKVGTSTSSSGEWPVLSANNRYVVFESGAGDLVPGDNNHTFDIFRRDLQTGVTERVSVNPNGGDGDRPVSDVASISGDGRYVAFESFATNLVPGADYGGVFVRDMATGTTRLIGANTYASAVVYHNPRITPDAHYLVYNRAEGAESHTYRINLQTGAVELVDVTTAGDVANNEGSGPLGVSADGRLVIFSTQASNLVASPPDTNGTYDVYLRDMVTGEIERVTTSVDGGDPNAYTANGSISGNGRFVVFSTYATNIVPGDDNETIDVFVRDLQTHTTERIATHATNSSFSGVGGTSLSDDGRFVAYTTERPDPDTDDVWATYVYDRIEHLKTVVSASALGQTATPPLEASISADGRYIAFRSIGQFVGGDRAGTLDVFVRATFIPRIDSVSPSTLQAEQPNHITIRGANFPPDARVRALTVSTSVIVDGTVTAVTPTRIEATITVSGDPGEIAYISVVAPGPGPGQVEGSAGTCTTDTCPVLSGP